MVIRKYGIPPTLTRSLCHYGFNPIVIIRTLVEMSLKYLSRKADFSCPHVEVRCSTANISDGAGKRNSGLSLDIVSCGLGQHPHPNWLRDGVLLTLIRPVYHGSKRRVKGYANGKTRKTDLPGLACFDNTSSVDEVGKAIQLRRIRGLISGTRTGHLE